MFLATQSIAFHLTDIQLLIKSLHRCETAAGKLRFSAFLNAIAEEESARQYIQANQHIVKVRGRPMKGGAHLTLTDTRIGGDTRDDDSLRRVAGWDARTGESA